MARFASHSPRKRFGHSVLSHERHALLLRKVRCFLCRGCLSPGPRTDSVTPVLLVTRLASQSPRKRFGHSVLSHEQHALLLRELQSVVGRVPPDRASERSGSSPPRVLRTAPALVCALPSVAGWHGLACSTGPLAGGHVSAVFRAGTGRASGSYGLRAGRGDG